MRKKDREVAEGGFLEGVLGEMGREVQVEEGFQNRASTEWK